MILGKIVGDLVSTIKCPDYEGYKLLLVQPVDHTGTPKGKTFLAVDAVQAGVDDTVLVIDEGGSARVTLDTPDIRSIRTVINGIVDEVTIDQPQRTQRTQRVKR
jgi:microcompartment protein CcmK/EutM